MKPESLGNHGPHHAFSTSATARTHTDTHTFAPCAMLLLHDKTWSVPGWWTIDPRGTGKNRETMATGFWGWVKQAVDKGGFRQREDQTSADRLSQVLIGEPGARACVWQHRSCHQSRYFGKNPKSSSFSSQLQADVRIIYQFLSVWLNFYVLLRNKSCNVSCTLTAGHRVGGLINQWNPVQCSYFMLQVIRQSFLWFVLRSHFFQFMN